MLPRMLCEDLCSLNPNEVIWCMYLIIPSTWGPPLFSPTHLIHIHVECVNVDLVSSVSTLTNVKMNDTIQV